MVINFENGVPFDPGFVGHISAILPNIQYVYTELDKYRNFGQKRNQFKMIFPKIEELVNNYVGFYAGCILWAKIIQNMDKPITNNFCYGGKYDEDETLSEVKFLKEYLSVLPKDVKYYIGREYTVNPADFNILDLYEEFLKINEGFINTEKTSDLKIPENFHTIDEDKIILEKIEQVIDSGKLFELKELVK